MHCHQDLSVVKVPGPSEVVQFYVGRFEKILDKQTNKQERKRVNKNVLIKQTRKNKVFDYKSLIYET